MEVEEVANNLEDISGSSLRHLLTTVHRYLCRFGALMLKMADPPMPPFNFGIVELSWRKSKRRALE